MIQLEKKYGYIKQYGYIYDLFYKNEIPYEDNLQDVYKIYKTYDLNKKIFPQLKSYDYFSKIDNKETFKSLCDPNNYVCKEYLKVNNYISKTEEDTSDKDYSSYFELKKIIGYTDFNFTGNSSNVIINYRKQLISQI